MPFELKPTRKKVPSVYKSLYINERLVEQLDRIAKENETSFNNVVISMKRRKRKHRREWMRKQEI